MDEKTKATFTNMDTWKRGLFMIVFAIISGIAKFIVTLVAVFQFITLLFKGQANEKVIPLGQNMSTYLYQITLFLTFRTDEMPFPFLDFPDGAPVSILNEGNKEYIDTTQTTTNNDEEIVVTTEQDTKEEIAAKKDTKDDRANG
jgi:hypothetical protein